MMKLWWLMVVMAFPVWAEPLKLEYGVNQVDINADGVADVIVKARYDTGTAHSSDRYMVMVRLVGDEDYEHEYYEVSKDGLPDYKFHSSEGAECRVVDYRFELDKLGGLIVTRYMRDEGTEWYCQAKPVTITTYKLTDARTDSREVGNPPFYLKKVKERRTLKSYESVSDLMK